MELAAVIVVRGEGDLAERAVASVHPFVDDVVVLALDDDPDLARRLTEAGARVVRGEWGDDASACRNAALDAAGADWSLVLDPEEYVADGASGLRESIRAGEDFVGLVEVHRAPGSPHGADHPRHLAARLLPRGVRFEGAYREEPVFELPTRRTDVVLASDDTETGRWRADHRRTEALLLQSLAVRPGDPALLRQLADELRRAGRHADASRAYESALLAMTRTDEARHAVVVGALECHVKSGRLREAVALVDDQASTWQHSPDFAFLVGDLFFEMMLSVPGGAGEVAPLVESSWRRCLELGERPDLAGAVHGRGSFLAAQNLYVLNLVLGRVEEAEEWSARAAAMRIPSSSVGKLLG